MELVLKIVGVNPCTIGDLRHLEGILVKDGYNVEILPTEITPQIIKISK